MVPLIRFYILDFDMKKKIQIGVITIIYALVCALVWLKPVDDISDSELRMLAQRPELSFENLTSGKYMSEFEKYALDQFPFRDELRSVKAVTYLYAMQQLDNNGIYITDGYAVKMEYPYNPKSVEYACGRFENIYNKFLKDSNTRCYISIIPDKNYFLAKKHGALSLEYDRLIADTVSKSSFAEYIDIVPELSIEDYYHTDTHWDQGRILPVANKIVNTMTSAKESGVVRLDFAQKEIEAPLYGVYYGQAALPMKPDKMVYLYNEYTDSAVVLDRQNNKEIPMYDEKKFATRSPYDVFLGGSLSLISIKKPDAYEDDRSENESIQREKSHLIVFRDSFGSSLIPLLIPAYDIIDVVDIRYIQSERLKDFIDFNDADVLFLYSVPILNNSNVLK